MRQEVKEDVSRSIRGAIGLAVPIIVVMLIAYTIFSGGSQ